jgi:hypothetical protein
MRIYALTLQAGDERFTIARAGRILGFSLLWWVSLPYIQVKVNRILRKSVHTQKTVEVFT